MADMLFAAATDHRYLDVGHVLDFTNKAFEALDVAGWSHAEPVLASLSRAYAGATRMEESNAWRNPVNLVEILEDAFEKLPSALDSGRHGRNGRWEGREELASVLLGEGSKAIASALLEALREGATEEELAQAVAYAGATHRPVPHHERVRRLGYRTAHLYLRQRCAPGAEPNPLSGAAARGFRRGDEHPPRPLPKHSIHASA